MPPIEQYQIKISDDLYPVGLRFSRIGNVITITFEYLLTGIDSRDPTNELVPLKKLYRTRVLTIDDSEESHPTNVMQALQLIGDHMETLAKEVEFPST